MLEALFRLTAELGPMAMVFGFITAAVVVVFVVYVGIALHAVLHAPDQEQREVRYQVFRDLVDLFRRGSRQ